MFFLAFSAGGGDPDGPGPGGVGEPACGGKGGGREEEEEEDCEKIFSIIFILPIIKIRVLDCIFQENSGSL